jgi:alanine racemase
VTVPEAVPLRDRFREARIVVMGPVEEPDLRTAREARLELVVGGGAIPDGIPVHLKLDTGMGRYGYRELPEPTENVVGLMTHLATADTDSVFANRQLELFRQAAGRYPKLLCHAANSAAALRIPEARFNAGRCGVALYGLSPFGTDPAEDHLEPVLAWHSRLAQVKRLHPGESTGYGRRFVADRHTWIGLVPVGYGDGFRRDLTGTEVLVSGERCRAIGTVSMDSFAVELPRELPEAEPVTIIGDGLLVEEHARHAGTINYEITTRIEWGPERAEREIVHA